MAYERLALPRMDWTAGTDPKERRKASATHPVSLLSFASGFADPSWCERGHAGLVLSGELVLEFDTGIEVFRAGEAFVIDPSTRHRASNPADREVVLFIVSSP